jgi:hypothetical protein
VTAHASHSREPALNVPHGDTMNLKLE